ncbi:MAG: J domain-containing protein [Burkholderiales bacterium]
MPDRAAADRTAKLLLWFTRDPMRYRAEARRRDAPPLDGEVVLRLALGHRVEFSDPAMRGANAAALRDAAAAYVRRAMFAPGATAYQILGLPPGASAQAVKENFRLLMQLVHPDRQDAHAVWPEDFAARANRAHDVLRNDEARAKLDRDEAERAARARAKQQKAAAAAATASPRRALAPVAVRRPPPRPLLPEWLTAGVGGFVRRHPAVVAFALLLGSGALVIGMAGWNRPPGSLMRDADAPRVAAPAASAPVAAPTATATVPAAPLPADRDTGSGVPSPRAAPPAATATPDPTRPPAAKSGDPVGGENAVVAAPPVATAEAPAVPPPAQDAEVVPVRLETAPPPDAGPQALTVADLDALSAALADAYDRGRVDAFAALFADDARTNLHQGRAAIRGEYDELFRLSEWRQMRIRQLDWRRTGDRAHASGELEVRIGWRDGRVARQSVAVDVEVARRDGRALITRLAHEPGAR